MPHIKMKMTPSPLEVFPKFIRFGSLTCPKAQSIECKISKMVLPGDAHPEEEANVDQHLVSLLATVPAFAVGTRTTKMEKEEIVTYSFLQMLVTT